MPDDTSTSESSTNEPNTSERQELRAWLTGRLPEGWFVAEPEVTVDRDEITIVGTVAAPGVDGDDGARRAAEAGRIRRFREETRDERIGIARALEHRSGRHVAWGVVAGSTRELFTNLSVPTMTRLRQPERVVLDTLVDAGVARSRSDALGWCVRLVAEHSEQWLADLRTALGDVERLRAAGPAA